MITLTYIRTSRFRCKLHLLSSTNSRCRFRYHFWKKWLEFTHWKSSCLHQRVFSAQLIASTQQICRAMGTVVYIMTLTDLRMLTHLIVPHLQNTGEEHPSGSNYSTNKSSRSSKKPALVRRTRGNNLSPEDNESPQMTNHYWLVWDYACLLAAWLGQACLQYETKPLRHQQHHSGALQSTSNFHSVYHPEWDYSHRPR